MPLDQSAHLAPVVGLIILGDEANDSHVFCEPYYVLGVVGERPVMALWC